MSFRHPCFSRHSVCTAVLIIRIFSEVIDFVYPSCQQLKFLPDLGAITWIGSPLAAEVFDVPRTAATHPPESRIDKPASQTSSAGIRLQVLYLSPDPYLYALERIPGDAVPGRPNPAEVILPAMDITTETQEVRFDAHLTKCYIVIDTFDSRFFDIVLCNHRDLAHVGFRVRLQEEPHQSMHRRQTTTHYRQRAAHIKV